MASVGRPSKIERIKEYARCVQSPIHYGEKYCQVFDLTKGGDVPFVLFPTQKTFINNCLKHRFNIVRKPRQTGVSTTTALYASTYAMFESKRKVLIIANKQDIAQEFLKKVKHFIRSAPEWMGIIITRETQGLIELNNGSIIKAVATSEDALRGFTPTLLIMDEAAYIRDGEAVWTAAQPSLSSGGKAILLSTPSGLDALYYAIYDAAKNKRNNFHITEFKWYEDPRFNKQIKWIKGDMIIDTWLNKTVKEEDFKDFEKLEQLGFTATSPWFEDMCRQLNGDQRKIAQEILGSFLGSGDNVIDEKYIEIQEKENVRTPIRCENFDNNMWIWEEPIKDHQYVLGCLPQNEKILTYNGLKNVENININDKLIDENGNYTDIFNKQIYNVINEDVYKIKLSNVYRETIFTKEHPILVSKNTELKRNWKLYHQEYRFRERYWDFNFDFIKSSELKVKDWIKYPNIYIKELNKNDILNKWSEYENLGRIDFKIKNPLLNKDFWWYVGIWLAEGWYQNRGNTSKTLATVHNINEKEYAYKINDICQKFFNRKATFTEKNNIIQTQFNSKQLYGFFLENFGKYAKNKKIPEWVKFLPKEFKIELVRGYLEGDGCWISEHRKNKKFSKITFVSVSLELLEGIQDILFSLGIISALTLLRNKMTHIIRNKEVYCDITYQLNLAHYDSLKLCKLFDWEHNYEIENNRIISNCFISKNNKWIYHRIKNINKFKYSGKVFNFETKSHTFLCKNITTHNCDIGRGDSADYSTIQIIDLNSGHQVAEYQAHVPPDYMGELIFQYSNKYQAYCIVDITGGMGVTPVLKLLDLGIDKKLLHYDLPKSKVLLEKLKIQRRGDKIPGFNIGANRILVIQEFERQVRQTELIIRSKRLVSEMKTFVYRNGRPDHMVNFHDDCLKKGTLIKTITGYRDIEDILVGDMVLTHKGRYKPVIALLIKPFDGEWYNMKFSGQVELGLSYNHPLYSAPNTMGRNSNDHKKIRKWVLPGDWEKQKNGKKNYNKKSSSKPRQISINEKLNDNENKIIYYKEFYEPNKHDTAFYKGCISNIILDQNFSKFLGLFLADGNAYNPTKKWLKLKQKNKGGRYGISIAFNERDIDMIEEMEKYLFSLCIKSKRNKINGCILLYFSSKFLWFLLSECYDKNREKQLPYYAKYLGKDLEYVLDYWLKGDGCKDNRGHYDFVGATTSKKLALSMRDIAWSINRYAMIRKNKRHRYGKKCKDQYWVHIRKEKRLHDWIKNISDFEYGTKTVKIKKENYKGNVYNLQVADDESFTANGIVVHNCIFAMAMGLFVAQTSFKNLKMYNAQTKAMLNSITTNNTEYKDEITPQTDYLGRSDTKQVAQQYSWLLTPFRK